MALGTVLKVELADPDPGYASGTADAVLAAARDAPQPPAVFSDFWTLAYQAIDD